MKTRYIVLGILLSATLSLSARIYTTGEDIYVNVKQSDAVGDWSKDGAKIFFYLWQSTSTTTNLWLEASHVPGENESIVKAYKVTIPSTAATWYDRVIIVRGTAAGWSTATKWNQTSDIDIPDNSDCNCNMLNIFDPSESNKWSIYSPSAEGIGTVAAGETADEIHVCAAAAYFASSETEQHQNGIPVRRRDRPRMVLLYGWYQLECRERIRRNSAGRGVLSGQRLVCHAS